MLPADDPGACCQFSLYGRQGQRKAARMNDDNLISLRDRTTSEQREIASKGGKASGKARRERRLIREALQERMNAKDLDEVCDKLIERAKNTARDFEVLRDTLGEKPNDSIALSADDMKLDITIDYGDTPTEDAEQTEKGGTI